MTGVGKSAVVDRLVELISFQKKCVQFTFGGSESYSFNHYSRDFLRRKEEEPLIVVLDEFQKARTIDQKGTEIGNKDHPDWVWSLLDSGSISGYDKWCHSIDDMEQDISQLMSLLEKGVVVKNGKVISGINEFIRHFEQLGASKRNRRFVPDIIVDFIFKHVGYVLDLNLRTEFDRILDSLDGPQTVQFLSELLEQAERPIEKTFRRLLVFVMGNLDEAFSMARELKPDVDPDVFYLQTQRIGLPEIKEALQARFRSEQIARLGNIHIIYPGIRRASFELFIERQLRLIAENKKRELGVDLVIDPSVNRLLYLEGVCPTQGFRPLISSIQQILLPSLARFFSDLNLWERGITRLTVSAHEGEVCGEGVSAQGKIYRSSVPVPTPLTVRRKEADPEEQAIVAVHEAGHVIAGIFLPLFQTYRRVDPLFLEA